MVSLLQTRKVYSRGCTTANDTCQQVIQRRCQCLKLIYVVFFIQAYLLIYKSSKCLRNNLIIIESEIIKFYLMSRWWLKHQQSAIKHDVWHAAVGSCLCECYIITHPTSLASHLRSHLTRVGRQCSNENEKKNLFYTCSMFWAPAPHPLLCRDKGRGDWLVHTAVQPLAYSTVSCWAREAEISSCLPVTLCELGGTGHIATSVLRTNRSQTTPTKRCHVEISVLNRHVLNWTDEWLNAIVISLKW